MHTAFTAYPVTVKFISDTIIQYYQVVENKSYSFLKTTNLLQMYQSFQVSFHTWHNNLPLGPTKTLQIDDLTMGYRAGLFAQAISLWDNEMADLVGATSGEDTARFEYLKQYTEYRNTQTLRIIYEIADNCNPNILESMFCCSYSQLR